VAKVFQGILMAEPISVQDNDMFARLWMHECSRVFADRLCTQADKEEFQKQVCDLLSVKFKVKWGKPEECFGPGRDVLFSTLLRLDQEAKYYELIENRTRLDATLEDQLIEYNFDSSSKMDLVFFEDAIQHILRILRILMQPRGNAMLIGLSGSGKQSLTKFSAAILTHECF
jgi:dynein heavy chain